MPKGKNCLFITASTSACAGEVKVVKDCLSNLAIGFREIEWLSSDDFANQTKDGVKYDFIYLGAHSDAFGFGEKAGGSLFRWEEFGTAICLADCILPDGTLFLGCCRGGMRTIALKILSICEKINYICGPHWKVKGNDLTGGFQAFVQSLVRKEEEPLTAIERASAASGCKFAYCDRMDLETDLQTLRTVSYLEYEVQRLAAKVSALEYQNHLPDQSRQSLPASSSNQAAAQPVTTDPNKA